MCIAVDIIGFRNFGLNTCVNARPDGQVGQTHLKYSNIKYALIIDTLDDLGTGGDRNAKQLKLALQTSFTVSIVLRAIGS
jgi:hypothetical protein